MRLADWGALFILIAIPIFHRLWMARNRRARVAFSVPIPAKVASRDPTRALLLFRYLGLALLVVALARPQSSFQQTERTVSGVDIMMVLDVSASMRIEDLGDRSRLEIAKQTMERFLQGRENDRIGFIMFSGEALTLAPPTLDYALVQKAIRDADIGILKDGTAIGDGLSLAINRLKESKAKSRVIILCTDGDNNLGQVDPATAGELAAGYGIRVYTIAIGREGRVKLPIPHKGMFGNTVTTYQWFDNALNPELLKEIAQLSGGRFYRVEEGGALESVFQEINSLEKSEIKTNEHTRYEETFPVPLKLGLLILLLERMLAIGWWRFAT